MDNSDPIPGYHRQEHQKILLSEDVELVMDCCDIVLSSAVQTNDEQDIPAVTCEVSTALLSTVVNKVIRMLSTNIIYSYTAPMDSIETYDLVLEIGPYSTRWRIYGNLLGPEEIISSHPKYKSNHHFRLFFQNS